MDCGQAVGSFDALSHEARLTIFKMLVNKGKEGMNAGDIARELDMPLATFSFHVTQLIQSGLVHSRKSGRYVIYSADFSVVHSLVQYLLQNCCEGSSDESESCDELMSCVSVCG